MIDIRYEKMKSHFAEDFIIPVCTQVLTGNVTQIKGLPSYQPDEWDEICEYASFHGLLAILMSYVHTVKIKDEKCFEVVCSWYLTAECDSQTAEQMSQTVEKLVRIMQRNNLDVMLLKGLCLAQYYPSTQLRTSADIDFYLYGKQEEGLKALEIEGVACDDAWDYHAHAEMNGVRLELHQEFIDIDRVKTNEIVEQALVRLAEEEGKTCRCRWMGEDVTNAYRMTPTMNAIFLMRHMAIHFVSETVTLRMLYDWALFLYHEGNDVNWENTRLLYDKVGMTDFARRILYIVIFRLGMPVATCCPLEPLNGEGTDRLWNYILHKEGNGLDYSSALKAGVMRRYELIKGKWKYDMVYPKDSFWKTFLYLAFRGVRTISERR